MKLENRGWMGLGYADGSKGFVLGHRCGGVSLDLC